MPASLIQYRLRVRNASTLADPDGTDDAFIISSVPTDTAPYIAAAPSGDGQEVDPITGAVRTGSYTVEIVDANTGTDGTGTIRYLTSRLEDATFRQQLLSRRAYVEIRTDGGAWSTLIAGYILGVRLISPMRYAIAVGDTRRVEQTQNIFSGGALGSYTTRGCVIGGPVTSDWGPVKSRGGWKYRVAKSGNDVTLTFVEGYAATFNAPVVTDWRKVVRPEQLEAIANYRTVNPYAIGGGSSYVTAYTTSAFDFAAGDWVVASGVVAWIGTSATNAAAVRALVVSDSQGPTLNVVNLYWPSCPHSTGDTVYLSLTTTDVTETTPLYLDAHPVDIVTAIWTNARINYNPAALWVNRIRTLIGMNVRLACRFTDAPKIAEFLEQAIYGPFGVASRTTSAGLQELFPTRIRTDVVPSLTLAASAIRSADPVVFDLDEATAVSSIALTQQVFGQATYVEGQASTNGYTQTQSQGNPLDAVVVSTVTQTAQYLDPNLTVFAGREISYSVPGMIHTATDWVPATTPQLDAIAVGVFDRFGRGAAVAEVEILAGTGAAAAQVGDEVYFEGPSFPNKGYRIGESSVGARIMQVVRRTETPAGPTFKLLDSGLAAQPATAATISIAASSGAPTTVAAYTITNAATLNATGVISVEVEWSQRAITPTGGESLLHPVGQIPTGAVNLKPQTSSGQTVWVRARSLQAGRRPSAWSAWASVTLSTIPTITGATISNIKTTAATVSWTNTSTAFPVVVFAYQGASAPASWTPFRVASVPAGSTSTIVRNLTGPSVAWTIGLAYESAGVLGPVTAATLTTNSTTDTSNRPAGLAVIFGVDDATLPQGIALAIWPSDQALDVVVERSTTSGSGFAEVGRIAGSTPTYVDSRPRDGVTYYYRIAHVLGGYGLSPYSQEVSAIARGVPRDVVRPDAVGPVVQVETTETATQGTVELTITDPQGRVDQVRFRHRTGGGAWSAWTVDTSVPYSYTETLPGSGFLDIQYEVNGYNAAGVYGLLAGGTESFDRNPTADMVSVVGTFTNTGNFLLAIAADTDTASIKYAVSTISQPTLATVQGQTAINSRNYSVTITGPVAVGATMYVSVLGYTGINGTGTESSIFEYRFTRDGGLIYTQCSAVATSASTATTIQAFVTGTAPTGTPTVQLVSVTGSATQIGGPAVGVPSASGTLWTFSRGAALGPTGGAIFRSVLAGAVSDDDFLEIPEQGRDTTYLIARARVLTTTATQVVARVAVLDKYSALSSTIGYTAVGTGTVTPASGQVVTTAVGDTFASPETVGSYVDYTIDRPAFGAGTGRVTFTATATGRVADSDAVDIPAQERDTIALTSRARIFSQTPTQMVVRYAVATPVALSPNTASIAYVTEGLTGVTPGSPQTITPETNTQVTEALGSYVDFTVPRPAVGANPGRIAFQGTATGRTATSDSVDIPPQERIGPSLKVVTTPSAASYSLVVTWDGTIVYNLDGASQSVSGWTSPRTVTINRNDFLGATQVAAFSVTKDNVTVSESVNIPAKDTSGASITIGTQTADDTTNIYTFTWTPSGFPTGTTYDLIYTTTTTAGVIEQGTLNSQTSPVDVTSGYTIGANPTYQMTINAIKDGTLILTKSRSGTFLT